MKHSARLRPPSVELRARVRHRAGLALAPAVALAAALALAASPASAVVTTVPSTTTTVGLQPRSTTLHAGDSAEAKQFANPTGNAVLPANKTYAIYWDPTDNYHGDWQASIDAFFQNMAAASGSLLGVFAVDAQYTDAANKHATYASTFQGAYTDTDAYPIVENCADPHPLEGLNYPWGEPDAITCITNAQIEKELKLFISDHSLPTGMGTIFYLLTPPGVTVCLDEAGSYCSDYSGSQGSTSYDHSFCSYHSDMNPDKAANGDSSTILYAAIPWSAGGLADYHLGSVDQTGAYECQDGGFDPVSKPIEEKEKAKERNESEEIAFGKEDLEEKAATEKAELLAGPHQQEPNQVACPSLDGYCDAGLADLIVNQIGVEQQNIVTDPLLASWKDPSGDEATDECRDFFAGGELGGSVAANPETFAGTLSNQSWGGGKYYLNDAFNLAALNLPYTGVPCRGSIDLAPRFTAPSPVNSGEIVGFDGMESDITLNWGTAYSAGKPKPTYATYTWDFGDETPPVSGFAPGAPTGNSPSTSPCGAEPWEAPCAASTFHSFRYAGTYEVTLTVTDTAGNRATFTEPITVNGTPRPVPPLLAASTTGSGSAAAGSASAGAGTPAKGVAPKPLLPAPFASQAVGSSSLSKSLRGGLLVRYSVNEQVTGHFEVLLAASIAHRLGLHLPLAGGLPAGTPQQVVIAKALLITTKGGRGTLKIQFGRVTAARLRRLHKVSLMLRMNLRDASGTTATVLSTLTLH